MCGSAACLPANRVVLRCLVCLLMDLERKGRVRHGRVRGVLIRSPSYLYVTQSDCSETHDLMLTRAQPILDKVHLLLKLGHLETHMTLSLLYQLVKGYS